MANFLRLELHPHRVHSAGIHVDMPMAALTNAPKTAAADLVRKVYDGLVAGEFEVLANDASVGLKVALSAPLKALYPQLA